MSLNERGILDPKVTLNEEIFRDMEQNERILESDNCKEIVRIYTGNEVFRVLNAQLRFAKRDMFLLSAQITSKKISNALMQLQKENPKIVYTGKCYRGLPLT